MKIQRMSRSGSWILYLFDPEADVAPRIDIEIARRTRSFGAELRIGGEGDATLGVGLGPMAFFTFKECVPQEWKQWLTGNQKTRTERTDWEHRWLEVWYGCGRESGIRFYEHAGDLVFSAELWRNGDWSYDDHSKWPWEGNGWHLYIRLVDAILTRVFGKTVMDEEDINAQPVLIHMPEGDYQGLYSAKRVRWRRPRSPFHARWMYREEIEIPNGIPKPGKGTTSYNYEDDALLGTTFAASEDTMGRRHAAEKIALDVLKFRGQYGSGMRWVPNDGWPEHLEARA